MKNKFNINDVQIRIRRKLNVFDGNTSILSKDIHSYHYLLNWHARCSYIIGRLNKWIDDNENFEDFPFLSSD